MAPSTERNSTLKLASGLGAALAFLTTEAAAAIQYRNPNPDVGSISNSNSTVFAGFNPITGETSGSTGSDPDVAIALVNNACSATLYFGCSPGTITSVGFLNTPLTANTVIDASTGSWVDSTNFGTTFESLGFENFSNALFAYRFKTTADANTYLYGWAEFSRNSFSTSSATLHAYAFEDTGAGIAAGAIPEPGATAAIFGLAALALIGFRRIRQRTILA